MSLRLDLPPVHICQIPHCLQCIKGDPYREQQFLNRKKLSAQYLLRQKIQIPYKKRGVLQIPQHPQERRYSQGQHPPFSLPFRTFDPLPGQISKGRGSQEVQQKLPTDQIEEQITKKQQELPAVPPGNHLIGRQGSRKE